MITISPTNNPNQWVTEEDSNFLNYHFRLLVELENFPNLHKNTDISLLRFSLVYSGLP